MKKVAQPGVWVAAVSLAVALSFGVVPGPGAQAQQASASSTTKPKPLSADDVALLLIGGASPQKMMILVQQRGVDFALNPDLVKQFYQDGASDGLIDSLQKAGQAFQKAMEAAKSQANTAPAPANPATAPAPAAPPEPGAASPQPGRMPGEMPAPASAAPSASGTNALPSAPRQPVSAHGASGGPAPAANQSAAQAKTASNAPLPDPSQAQISQIIQAFAAKEKLFKEARDNYTYHQVNKVYEYGADGTIDGTWEQDWDILFGQNNKRIEKVTYAPENTLKQVILTEQDIQSFRNVQPFVLTTDDLPEYDVQYMGHVHLDEITCYVFSVRPKEFKKHQVYFKGVVWVDDRDLQIVKASGQIVPEGKQRFPRFSTWRQQIDGKYWFPTFTRADDTLYFSQGPPVHIREIIKYTDYKQFKANFKILSSTEISPPATAAPPPPKH